MTGLSETPLDIVTGQVSSLQIDLSRVDTLLDVLDFVAALQPVGVLPDDHRRPPPACKVLLAGGRRGRLRGRAVDRRRLVPRHRCAPDRSHAARGCSTTTSPSRGAAYTWNALGGDLMTMLIIAAVVGFVVALGAWLAGREGTVRYDAPPPPPPRRRTSYMTRRPAAALVPPAGDPRRVGFMALAASSPRGGDPPPRPRRAGHRLSACCWPEVFVAGTPEPRP